MISIKVARKLVLSHTPVLTPLKVPIESACGRILAEDIYSDEDYPPFDRAMMDGFAVRLCDQGKWVRIVAEIAAGSVRENVLTDCSCVEIMTGAPIPKGTQAVVPVEATIRNGESVKLPERFTLGSHISQKGSECRKGMKVALRGDTVTPLVIANLANFGRRNIKVIPWPSVAIITTGNELSADRILKNGQIRNSNGPMLLSLAAAAGVSKTRMLHSVDRIGALTRALGKTRGFDVVLFCGGVSAGKYDLVPEALARFGARSIFHKVRQKPGKPFLFATKERQVFVGLPGTPLGSLLNFHRYVTLVIRKMSARPTAINPCQGILARTIVSTSDRDHTLLARAERKKDQWFIFPIKGKGSSDIFSPCRANACITLGAGKTTLKARSGVPFEFLGDSYV
ncbi:MAG: molybdopterin molybdotransferase MoeA [Deltaproteobacteria bacterium]|nr:molybdopterin molybdotransferase MoeA [Deltaproteobacteria bacterium]